MNTKDFAIGVLSVTAVILLSALLIIQSVAPRQAMAFGEAERAGDYLVSTAQLDDTAELLVIVDAYQQKMNVYGFNVPVGQTELIQQTDLSPLTRIAAPRPVAPRRERER
jgi:hypothetical protein